MNDNKTLNDFLCVVLHFLIRPSLVETGFADFILRCVDMHPVFMQVPRIFFCYC